MSGAGLSRRSAAGDACSEYLRWAGSSRAGLLPPARPVSRPSLQSHREPRADHSPRQDLSSQCLLTANISSSEDESSLGARSSQVSVRFSQQSPTPVTQPSLTGLFFKCLLKRVKRGLNIS